MARPTLQNRRILVVEDENILALDLQTELEAVGAIVLGPKGTVEDALQLILSESHIDAAILDVNLRGKTVLPVAEMLSRRGVPFIFTTGYDASDMPQQFDHVVRFEKPFSIGLVKDAIARALRSRKR